MNGFKYWVKDTDEWASQEGEKQFCPCIIESIPSNCTANVTVVEAILVAWPDAGLVSSCSNQNNLDVDTNFFTECAHLHLPLEPS
jgi:hypothetical protein